MRKLGQNDTSRQSENLRSPLYRRPETKTHKHYSHAFASPSLKRGLFPWIRQNFFTKCEHCAGGIRHALHSPALAILLVHIIWGVSVPITKLALTQVGAGTLLFLRVVLACLILFPFVIKEHRTFTLREQTYIIISAVFGIFLHILFIYIALPYIPAVNAPIIASLSPFFMILFSRLFFGETTQRRKYAGVFFGFVGVVVLTVLPSLFSKEGQVLSADVYNVITRLPFDLTPTHAMWIGNGLVVCSVIFLALGSLVVKPIQHISGKTIAFWQCAIVACLTLPVAISEIDTFSLASIGVYAWVGILYTGIISSVVAYSLYNGAIRKVPAADVGLSSYLSPIAALLLGIPLLGEFPSWWFIIGALFIFIGVWVAEHKTHHLGHR